MAERQISVFCKADLPILVFLDGLKVLVHEVGPVWTPLGLRINKCTILSTKKKSQNNKKHNGEKIIMLSILEEIKKQFFQIDNVFTVDAVPPDN